MVGFSKIVGINVIFLTCNIGFTVSGDTKASSAKECGTEENTVLNAENAVQSDNEENTAREKEESSEEIRIQPKVEVEPSQQLEEAVQRL